MRSELLTGAMLVIIAEGFLSRLSFGIVSFALPLYARALGLGLAEIGFLFSLNAVVEQALKPVTGWAADRFGLKRSFTAAIALRSGVALLLVFADAPWQLYAIRMLHGVSESLRDPAVTALIADSGGERRIASAFAWYQTAKSVAGSVGKGLAGLLLGALAYNYSGVFLAAFILSGLPLYVVARYVKPDASRHVAHPPAEAMPAGEARAGESNERARARLLPFVGMAFLISATANMLQSLFPVLATEYGGLSAAETGLIYTASIAVVVLAGPLFGWLSDNVSRRVVLMTRGVSNVVSSVIYFAFPTFAGIAAGKFADDLGKAAFRPAWGALMAHVSSLDRRSRARTISYLSMGEGFGEIAGPVLAGLLWGHFGLAAVLGARVLLAVVGEIYVLVVTAPLEKSGGRDPALKRSG